MRYLTTKYKDGGWYERLSSNEFINWKNGELYGYSLYRDCDDSIQAECVYSETASFEQYIAEVTKQRLMFWERQMLPYVVFGKLLLI